jgi:uncharacterized membrane protein YhaH (DUF805 family)
MKKFYQVFKNRARKPGYWVSFTTRLVIGVLVAVIAKLILNHL